MAPLKLETAITALRGSLLDMIFSFAFFVSWDEVFVAPIAHFVPCFRGSNAIFWMVVLGAQAPLSQPPQLRCPAQRFQRSLRQRRRCSRRTRRVCRHRK